MEDQEFHDTIAKVIGAVVSHPDMTKLNGSGKVYSFGATDGGYDWYIDASGPAAFGEGIPDRFDVRATMTKEDWLKTLRGQLSPTQAMLRKKIKVEGSTVAIMGLSMDALIQTYTDVIGPAA